MIWSLRWTPHSDGYGSEVQQPNHSVGQFDTSHATGKDQDEDEIAYVLAPEIPILTMTETRQNSILYANYEATDLEEKVYVVESLRDIRRKSHINIENASCTFSGGRGTIWHWNIALEENLKHFNPNPVQKCLNSAKEGVQELLWNRSASRGASLTRGSTRLEKYKCWLNKVDTTILPWGNLNTRRYQWELPQHLLSSKQWWTSCWGTLAIYNSL